MTEITGLSTTDSSNTEVTGESIDGAIANMGRMDNTLQAILGLLARSIRTNVLRFLDNTDDTKRVALDLSGLPTATTRTWTAPYYSGTLGLVSDIRGYVYGLTMTTNVSDPANDVDIASGLAVDTTGARTLVQISALTKRADASWAVGTGNGWLDTGAIGNNRYAIYEIGRTDGTIVDSIISLSFSSPTLPANYTYFQLIGEITRIGGVNSTPLWYGSATGADRRLTQSRGGYAEEYISRIDFGNGAGASAPFANLDVYRDITLKFYVLPATDGAVLGIRTSTNNGSSYDSGGSDYNYQSIVSSGGTVSAASGPAAQWNLGGSVGSASGRGIWGTITIHNFNKATVAYGEGSIGFVSNAGVFTSVPVNGGRAGTTARNAIQLLFSSGNIASGYVVLSGVRG